MVGCAAAIELNGETMRNFDEFTITNAVMERLKDAKDARTHQISAALGILRNLCRPEATRCRGGKHLRSLES
jgi:hypothetical protein